MKMRVDGQSLIGDMVGFERKFKAELTKMRKDVEIFLQFSKRIIAVVGLKEQKTRDSVLLMMVIGASRARFFGAQKIVVMRVAEEVFKSVERDITILADIRVRSVSLRRLRALFNGSDSMNILATISGGRQSAGSRTMMKRDGRWTR